MLTLDQDGSALTITQEGITMPANYSFKCINDFVHAHDTDFESLQYLALGMATYIEDLELKK